MDGCRRLSSRSACQARLPIAFPQVEQRVSAIYISHSSRDNTQAADIQQHLVDNGHRSIFLDFDPAYGIPDGRNWERELYARLRASQAVIVVCSTQSRVSQ
jgi:hypothetical protein